MKLLNLLLGCAALMPLAALALDPNSLTITQPWSRATPPGATVAVVYFDIINGGDADTLLRVESDVAARAEMHSSQMENGMMRMRPLTAVHIPANNRVKFESGGLHVMLVDLKQPLKEGQRFPIKLVFRVAGTMERTVLVQSMTADRLTTSTSASP
jgi:periplasmic copper chaperone A